MNALRNKLVLYLPLHLWAWIRADNVLDMFAHKLPDVIEEVCFLLARESRWEEFSSIRGKRAI